MSSTSDWFHFHQNNNNNNNNNTSSAVGHVAPSYAATSPPDIFFSGLEPESTTGSAPGPAQMGPAGRVGKPARRRTRASRRTPTTLLNTDTTNFRAMVQQFTGGPGSGSCPTTLPGLGLQRFGIGPGLGYGSQFSMAQVQYGNATSTMSSSSNNTNNINTRNSNNSNSNNVSTTGTNEADNNISRDLYFTTGSNINNVVNGGSPSSETRSNNNNNFQF
ncbi:hypothetical protein vseg_019526 [Gypsophila vaccaria]